MKMEGLGLEEPNKRESGVMGISFVIDARYIIYSLIHLLSTDLQINQLC